MKGSRLRGCPSCDLMPERKTVTRRVRPSLPACIWGEKVAAARGCHPVSPQSMLVELCVEVCVGAGPVGKEFMEWGS